MSRSIHPRPSVEQVSLHSAIELNNSSLSLFLQGDYDRAIEGLGRAFGACTERQQQLLFQGIPMSSIPFGTASSPSLSPVNGVKDSDIHDTSMAIVDDSPPCDDPDGSNSQDTTMSEEDVTSTGSSDTLVSSGNAPCSLPQPSLQAKMITGSAAAFNNNSTTTAAHTMYNRAFVLAPVDGEDSMLTRTSAIVLYNLALVHHNRGIHGGRSSALWDALKLYELALDTLDKIGGPTYHGGIVIHQGRRKQNLLPLGCRIMNIESILMAILNNMGSIHAHLYHADNTRACMRLLHSVLEASAAATSLLSTTNGNEDQVAAAIATTISEDYVFFLLNSMFQENELAISPAA